MAPHITESRRADIVRLLELNWKPQNIASTLLVAHRTVYTIQNNLLLYGSPHPPVVDRGGRQSLITQADGEALLELLLLNGWLYLDEVKEWLEFERNCRVSTMTISRFFKRVGWSRKLIRRIAEARSSELREAYLEDLRGFKSSQLVFLDESIFNRMTGWRRRGRAHRGEEATYFDDINRGVTWSVAGAICSDGWVSHRFKEGYFRIEDFLSWVREGLLPELEERRRVTNEVQVVILDNLSVHVNWQVAATFEAAGHLVRFLPPYSPDYNPIELCWSVLKAWIRRFFVYVGRQYRDFGEFLERAWRDSHCDRFALRQFAHAAGGSYIDGELVDRLKEQIAEFGYGKGGRRGGVTKELLADFDDFCTSIHE